MTGLRRLLEPNSFTFVMYERQTQFRYQLTPNRRFRRDFAVSQNTARARMCDFWGPERLSSRSQSVLKRPLEALHPAFEVHFARFCVGKRILQRRMT